MNNEHNIKMILKSSLRLYKVAYSFVGLVSGIVSGAIHLIWHSGLSFFGVQEEIVQYKKHQPQHRTSNN